MLRKVKKLWFVITLLAVAVIITAATLSSGHPVFSVLAPAGMIAREQRTLIYIALLLSIFVVVPVFVLTAYIVWKYRADKTESTYRPDWDGNRKLESLWWGLPCVIILVLGVITWQSSHQLDPYKRIDSTKPAVTVQAVALQYKWLFLYPDLGIASVNYLKIPTGRPVHFEITADAPMNSFWIPQLGGQVYAMPGMTTQLNLEATTSGMFRGSSANLSGAGFASMDFVTEAMPEASFADWAESVKVPTTRDSSQLTTAAYKILAEPNVAGTIKSYSAYDNQLFDTILAKYMTMGNDDMSGMHHGESM